MNDKTQMELRMFPALLVAVSLFAPFAVAADVAGPTTSTAPVQLATVAALFGEAPMSTSAASTATCGSSGHCNLVGCPDPDCPAGKTPTYKCSATGLKCEDKHDPFNPFDNDEHNVYNCTSACQSEPDPDECTVDNPLGDGCLVGSSCVYVVDPSAEYDPAARDIGAIGAPGC